MYRAPHALAHAESPGAQEASHPLRGLHVATAPQPCATAQQFASVQDAQDALRHVRSPHFDVGGAAEPPPDEAHATVIETRTARTKERTVPAVSHADPLAVACRRAPASFGWKVETIRGAVVPPGARAHLRRYSRDMKELFERLRSDHARIGSVADALDAFTAEAENTLTVDVHELFRFITFLRGFVDGYHYELEESVLLPALEGDFGNAHRGPLAHLRDQHEAETALVLKLVMAGCAPAPWGKAHVAAIIAAARAVTDFERAHMMKERDMLFPAAEQELTGGLREEKVAQALRRFDKHSVRRWDVEWLKRLADELVAAHVPAAPPASP